MITTPLQRHRQGGLTLIEVLIALLVLSIGLLGFAGLQASSMQFNHSAQMRTTATNLAYDMADRMRANRTAAFGGSYDINYGDTAPGGTAVADTDVREWLTAVGDSLPQGEGQVAVTPADGTATISIRWDDSRGEDPLTEFEMTTRI